MIEHVQRRKLNLMTAKGGFMANLGNPQETIAVLQRYGFNFQKKYGQNFLIDTHVLDKIIGAAQIGPDDFVLEIGPGIGTMTQYLAEAAREVIAVEIDTKLIPDTPQKRSKDISEILPEDMIDLPEIKEEKHVTLTAGSTISNTTPSAFSDEALDAMGQALTAKTELFAAEEEQVSFPIQMEEPKASRTVAEEAPFVIPGRPDPAICFLYGS